jgi:predicted ATPase
VSSGTDISIEVFIDGVQKHLRTSGYTQKDLANELNLNHKVLSRKLNGSGNAYLTRLEVKQIIITLARWKGITKRSEVLHLLELAEAGPNTFDADEWNSPPLIELIDDSTQSTLSSNPFTPSHPPRHNLPVEVTRLIGRQWAVEQLRKLLGREEVRLITLVGSGGSGKTRLAQHVARVFLDSFADGVWFVALAGVSDPDLVPMSIMQALNIQPAPNASPIQSLTTYLQDKHLLLILDNFEQVAAGATAVSELLAAAPGLKVLVTSRVVLHLYGEREFSVPPLDLPDFSVPLQPSMLSMFGAIQLFIERVQAVDPDFTVTAENAASIARICARVDGLPLALELAAARVKILSPALLLERLSMARLRVLIGGAKNLPGRQQTLRNTIMWSYELLSPYEQTWFCRLGVFNGSWSIEAFEALMRFAAQDQGDTLPALSAQELLEQLVNNSLVVRLPMPDGEVRFAMLETLREYAVERLIEKGELERLGDWHASYYLEMAETAEIGLRGPDQLEWIRRLSTRWDNFQAAMEWSLKKARAGKKIHSLSHSGFRPVQEVREIARGELASPGPVPEMEMSSLELCLRLTSALRPYLEWQGYLGQGRDRLKAVLDIPLEDGAEKRVLAARAKALNEMARLTCLQNDQDRAVELAEESIALWQQLDDAHGLATALLHRGWPAFALAQFDVAERVFRQGLQLLSATDDTWLHAQFLFYLGSVAGFAFAFEQMRTFYDQSLALFEQMDDKSAIADLLKDHGGMMILEGKYAQSVTNLVRSIKMSVELGHKQYITSALGLLGFAVGLREKPDPRTASLQAAQLWGAANSRHTVTGFTPWLSNLSAVQEVILQIRGRVEDQSWKKAFKAGQAMNEVEAISWACSL